MNLTRYFLLLPLVLAAGCGSSDNTAGIEQQRLDNEKLAQAKAEGAAQARVQERQRQLEREVKELRARKRRSGTKTTTVVTQATTPVASQSGGSAATVAARASRYTRWLATTNRSAPLISRNCEGAVGVLTGVTPE